MIGYTFSINISKTWQYCHRLRNKIELMKTFNKFKYKLFFKIVNISKFKQSGALRNNTILNERRERSTSNSRNT